MSGAGAAGRSRDLGTSKVFFFKKMSGILAVAAGEVRGCDQNIWVSDGGQHRREREVVVAHISILGEQVCRG